MQRQQQLQELEMRLLGAQVMNEEAHAIERKANAQKLAAQAGEAAAKPELEKLKIGTEARVEMEKLGASMEQNQQDLATRIRIAAGKEATMKTISQNESMTQRNVAGMNRMAGLQKSLMDLKSKAEDRKAAATKPKEGAKKSPTKA